MDVSAILFSQNVFTFKDMPPCTAAEEPVQIICFHHHEWILFHYVTDNYRGKNTDELWPQRKHYQFALMYVWGRSVIYRYAFDSYSLAHMEACLFK